MLTPLSVRVGCLVGTFAVLLCWSPGVVEAKKPNPWYQQHVIELGLFAGAYFPPKSHELYSLETDQAPFAEVAFDGGLRLGYLLLPFVGLELEGAVMPTALRDRDESAVVYSLRGHLLGQYPMRVTPFVVAGYGMLGVASGDTAVGNDIDGAFHAGLGAKFTIMPRLLARVDGRMIISGEVGAGGLLPHFEVLVGVSYQLWWKDTTPDRDKDGIEDKKDACPDAAGPAPDGCPPDKDGDGVPDDKDQCPDWPAQTPNGCPDSDGDGVQDSKDKCPEVAAKTEDGCPADKDGDGIPDHEDKCPAVAAKTKNGCPPDKDGDGVPDATDKCPDRAAKTKDGCPPDRDKDGIEDAKDKCPDKPETKNSYLDDDGCPDTVPKKVKRFVGVIRGIRFEHNSDVILKRSYTVLRQTVALLKKYPLLKVNVRGHADDTGTEDYNKQLSLRRAQSVRRFLVKRGVAADRLTVEGLGSSEPLVAGTSARARAKNRRVEFKVVSDGSAGK